jgi:hypothetical protein
MEEMTSEHPTGNHRLRSDFASFADGSLGFEGTQRRTAYDFGPPCMGIPHLDRVYTEYCESSADSLQQNDAGERGTTSNPESKVDLAFFTGTMTTVLSDFRKSADTPGLRFLDPTGCSKCLVQHREPGNNGLLWLIQKTREPDRVVSKSAGRRRVRTRTNKRFHLTVARITAVSDGTTTGIAFERTESESSIVDVQLPRDVFVPGEKNLEANKRRFEEKFDLSLRANPALKRFFQGREIDVREQGRLFEALIKCPVTVFPLSP